MVTYYIYIYNPRHRDYYPTHQKSMYSDENTNLSSELRRDPEL